MAQNPLLWIEVVWWVNAVVATRLDIWVFSLIFSLLRILGVVNLSKGPRKSKIPLFVLRVDTPRQPSARGLNVQVHQNLEFGDPATRSPRDAW